MSINILITGGKGFIGKKLSNKLFEKKYNIITYDLPNDILDFEKVTWFLKEYNIHHVFHLAAIADLNISRHDFDLNFKTNIIGTYNVAKACLHNKAMLHYASTCCAYGNNEIHPSTEESICKPSELYANSKLAGEYIVHSFKDFGLKYNIHRYGTTYGPEARIELAINKFIKMAIDNETIVVHGTGFQTRNYIYIDDLINGIIAAFESNCLYETINICGEEEISVFDIIYEIKKHFPNIEYINAKDRYGQIIKENISIDKLKRLCKFKIETNFADGVNKTVNWFMNQ